MAGRSSGLSMVAAHRLFAPPPRPQHGADTAVELDEADVIWGAAAGTSASSSPVETYLRAPPPHVGTPSKGGKHRGEVAGGGGAASLPVNIPDWSKILGAEYGGRGSAGAAMWPSDERVDGAAYLDGGEEGRGGRGWVPPHELLLCRERAAASFSVREGAGRTLKGRDLRRVRNAIWEKTGFQD
ncbi:hypothetical protein E2562_021575 [Oryza meyeriana var. granulata]|uniref:Senescence regulator n=1 Tax=Oryza meyeriana var. granulata TaxID=110450 RepID=A0A6G1EXZ6_9ORYZ|nr:hypothetical protein E2562_021575 [Oryza meyeriana var. granulata]